MGKPVHYKPSRCKPVCMGTHWPGALNYEEWQKILFNTGLCTTNVFKVTCSACLNDIALDINQRLKVQHENS